MIDEALVGTSVTVVLIGAQTSERKYVQYEINQSLARGNGLLGIRIHGIKDRDGLTSARGDNPLPNQCSVYDYVLQDGYANMGAWIEKAAKDVGR